MQLNTTKKKHFSIQEDYIKPEAEDNYIHPTANAVSGKRVGWVTESSEDFYVQFMSVRYTEKCRLISIYGKLTSPYMYFKNEKLHLPTEQSQ